MNVQTLLAAFERPEFAAGLRFGLVALAVGLVVALTRRSGGSPSTLTAAGLLFAAAFVAGLRQTLGLPTGLALGLVALGGAGVTGGFPSGSLLAPLLAIPGAWLVVSRSGLLLDQWVELLVGVGIVLGGWLVADFDVRWRRQGLGPVLLAISVAGVYATVPDTEAALVALGAALPLALLGWPWPLASLGRAGAYAATGSLLWVVGAEGVGRGSSLVGGVACLGLFAVEPMARLLNPDRESGLESLPSGRWGAWGAAVIHLGLVYVGARVAGTRRTVAEAAIVALVGLVAAVVLALFANHVQARLGARMRPGRKPDGGGL